jgi:predicted transcriptional regulator
MIKQPSIRKAEAGELDKTLEKLRRTLEAKKEKEAATPEPGKSRSLTRI